MCCESPSQRRRAEIESCRAAAERLIDRTGHTELQAIARTALNDLVEAEAWLQFPDIDVRPPILELADIPIGAAIRRLSGLNDWLRRYGCDGEALRD